MAAGAAFQPLGPELLQLGTVVLAQRPAQFPLAQSLAHLTKPHPSRISTLRTPAAGFPEAPRFKEKQKIVYLFFCV